MKMLTLLVFVKVRFLSLQRDSNFCWFVSQESYPDVEPTELKKLNRRDLTWLSRSEGPSFIPSSSDLGRFVRVTCTPRLGAREGEAFYAVSGCVISAGPGPCPFEERQAFTKEPLHSKKELRSALAANCNNT